MMHATTPSQRGNVTKRLKAFVAERAQLGFSPEKVEAGIRSWRTRLERKN